MRREIWIARLAIAVSIGFVLIEAVVALHADESKRAGFIADDGVYYLQLARNFAHTGTWTFDGVSRASGFHLLHAYLCALVYLLAPRISFGAMFSINVVVATILTVASITLLARVVARVFGPRGLLALPLVVASRYVLPVVCMGMEWPWAVFAVTLFTWSFVSGRLGWTCAAACLGTLARTDFAVLAASAALAGFLGHRRLGDGSRLRAGLAGGTVALVTLGACLLHTRLFSHAWFQANARMKAHWGDVRGYDLQYASHVFLRTDVFTDYLRLVLDSLGGRAGRAATYTLLLAAAAWLATRIARERGEEATSCERLGLLSLSFVSGAAYLLLYGRVAGLQAWYSFAFVLPAVVLPASILAELRGPRSLLLAAAIAMALGVRGVTAASEPTYRHQRWTREAGLALRRDPPEGRVGAWNAGMIGYQSDIGVVNLDGLANDDVLPYIVRDQLHCYLIVAHIGFVADARSMFDPSLAARGGYGDGLLASALSPLRQFGDANEVYAVVLYRVDAARLRARGDCGSADPAGRSASSASRR